MNDDSLVQDSQDSKIAVVLRVSSDHRGERHQFTGLLLEDMSGEYRKWLGHQEHRGRPFGEGAGVVETEVQFSVAVHETIEWPFVTNAPVNQPFMLHQPDAEDLSSPQVDMLFDVMSFLYQSIPAMKLMEDVRAQHITELAGKEKEVAAAAETDL